MIEQLLQADRLLTVDQVAQARDLYGRVVTLDPGNAIAVVGLARCALADGEDAEAHALAARALGLDPENDMARRMEARLAEVLAARGQPVTRPPAAAGGPEAKPSQPGAKPSQPGAKPSQPGAKPSQPVGGGAAQASAPASRRSFLDRWRGR